MYMINVFYNKDMYVCIHVLFCVNNTTIKKTLLTFSNKHKQYKQFCNCDHFTIFSVECVKKL